MRVRSTITTSGVRRAWVALVAALAVGLGWATEAEATTWFAAADGDGPAPCVASDPCAIHEAVDDAPTGTRVAALAGDYSLTSTLEVENGVSLRGPWSGPTAVIIGDGTSGPAIAATGAGTRVTDLAIEQSSAGTGIEIGSGALGDRLDATTSGFESACAPLIGALLRDSACTALGGGNGIRIDQSAGSGTIEIANVTAVSDGDGATSGAMLARAIGTADVDVEATNVIAASLGAAPDVAVGALIGLPSIHLAFESSNYDSAVIASGDATVTPAGTDGNQTADPIFSDATGGDFSEVAGSPTIDAGSTSAAPLGLLDLLRIARIGGVAPDIGAYEYVPPPDTRAPNVSIVGAPKGKLRTTERFVEVSFELASDETDVVFECRIDRLPVEDCASPVFYRLKASRGPGTKYLLTVRAVDAAGNRSGKAIRQVRVIRMPVG